jgi:hypothetical protein
MYMVRGHAVLLLFWWTNRLLEGDSSMRFFTSVFSYIGRPGPVCIKSNSALRTTGGGGGNVSKKDVNYCLVDVNHIHNNFQHEDQYPWTAHFMERKPVGYFRMLPILQFSQFWTDQD